MNTRRRIAIAGALLLALAGCRSAEQKAAIAESRYDQFFAQADYAHARQEIQRAVQLNQDLPGYWVKLGRVELVSGNLSGAYAAYTRALDLQRDNVEALQYLAQIAVAAGDLDGAREYLDSLLVLLPNDPRGRLAQGSVEAKDGHFDEALKITDEVLAQHPEIDDGYLLKATALTGLDRTPEAIATLEQRWAQGGQNAGIARSLLDLYKKTNNEAGMRTSYARLFKLLPNDTDIQIEFARALAARGNAAEGQAIIRKVQAQHADDPKLQLAAVAFWRDTAGLAAAKTEVARIASQGRTALRAPLAQFLLDSGDPAGARALAAPGADAAEVTADNIDAQVVLVGADAALGRRGAARARVDRVLTFDSTNARALRLRTELEIAANQLDAALGDVRVLVSDDPDDEPAQLLLAKVYAARKDWLLADATFVRSIQANPKSPLSVQQYIQFLVGRGKLPAAMRAASTFVQANEKSVPGWAMLGRLCVQARNAGCSDDAIRALGKLEGGAPVARELSAMAARAGRGSPDGSARSDALAAAR